MVKMSVAMKHRVSTVLSLCRVSFQFGFVPLILYLGFKKGAEEGMPELSFFSGPPLIRPPLLQQESGLIRWVNFLEGDHTDFVLAVIRPLLLLACSFTSSSGLSTNAVL